MVAMISGGTSFMFSQITSAIWPCDRLVGCACSVSCRIHSVRERPSAAAFAFSAAACSSGSSITVIRNPLRLQVNAITVPWLVTDKPRGSAGGALERLYEEDKEARQARDAAETQFDEADRRMSTSMACAGAQMAIGAWEMREKFIRKAEALGRRH